MGTGNNMRVARKGDRNKRTRKQERQRRNATKQTESRNVPAAAAAIAKTNHLDVKCRSLVSELKSFRGDNPLPDGFAKRFHSFVGANAQSVAFELEGHGDRLFDALFWYLGRAIRSHVPLPRYQALLTQRVLRMERDYYDHTLLHIACRCTRNGRLISFLLAEYPDAARVVDRQKRSPLHAACDSTETPSATTVRQLIEAFPEAVHTPDRFGQTPLHYACYGRGARFNVIHSLVVKKVALCLLPDNRGRLPLDIAKLFWFGFRVRYMSRDRLIQFLTHATNAAASVVADELLFQSDTSLPRELVEHVATYLSREEVNLALVKLALSAKDIVACVLPRDDIQARILSEITEEID